jgi:hypothetical protein
MALGRKTGGRPKGTPKTGGRIAGTPNKATVERAKLIAEAYEDRTLTEDEISAITPLDALLLVLRRRLAAHDDPGVLQAAVAAAPYCHARLSVSDIRMRRDPAAGSDVEISREIEALRARIEQARMAESPMLIEAEAEAVEVVAETMPKGPDRAS